MQTHGRGLGLVCVFVISWLAATNFTLNHFYVNGGAMLDSGWFAYLSVSAVSIPLPNPPSLGGTYFSTHLSPIFYLISAPYRLLALAGADVPSTVWFSITQGFWPAVMASSIFILLEKRSSPSARTAVPIALISVLLTFNGATLASIGFPHFELAIPAVLAAFFACYATEKFMLATAWLLLGLLVREDAGLHYFGLFFTLAAYLYFIDSRAHAKQFLFLAIFCALVSLLAITVQKTYFDVGDNALVRVYLGEPAFAHLSAEFLAYRIAVVTATRLYIFAPILVIVMLAFRGRNWPLLIGVVAILPWILFNILAVSVHAGNLSVHYSFPIAIMMMWPAILCGLQTYNVIPGSVFSPISNRVLLIIAMSSIGFSWQVLGFNTPHAATDFFPKWLGKIAASHTDLRTFMLENEGLKFIVDDAVASLTNTTTTKSQWRFMLSFQEKGLKLVDAIDYQPDAWLDDRVQELASKLDFQHSCNLPDSHFKVLSKSPTLLACIYEETAAYKENKRLN